MIYFYIRNYRIEIRKVKFPQRYNRKFLFIKYFKSEPSLLCKPCFNVRPQYKNCSEGLAQQNKKTCYYKSSIKKGLRDKVIIERRKKEIIQPDRVLMVAPGDEGNMYIDVELFNSYKSSSPFAAYFSEGVELGFGKNVFVFDINSCDFKEKS